MMTVHRLKLVPVLFFAVMLARESRPFLLDYRRPLLALRIGYRRIHPRLWWLLAGFAVSWLATQLILWFPAYSLQISNFYPVLQAVLIVNALYTKRAGVVLMSLVAVGVGLSIRFPSPIDYDFLLKTVAWLAIGYAGYRAWHFNALIRRSIAYTFGGGWAAWMILLIVRAQYVVLHIEPHNTRQLFTGDEFARWAPYLAFHAFWLVGAVLFCLGAADTPRLPVGLQNKLRKPRRLPFHLSV